MARKFKTLAILAKLESVPGTAATPSSSDAMLASNVTHEMIYNNPDRGLLLPYLGHGGMLVGSRHVQLTFDVELSGSSAAGTAPAWGALLQACAFAETIDSGTSVEYTPVTTALKTLTIQFAQDGVLHTVTGAMGTVSFNMGVGEKPTMTFRFVGTDGGNVAASIPTTDYDAWQIPQVINTSNTDSLRLGSTYTSGVVSGGTTYCSRGLTLDMANDAKFMELLGCGGGNITDRAPAGRVQLEATAAQEVALRTQINSGTPTSLSLAHGSGAGKQITFFCPQVMFLNPRYEDYEGLLLVSLDFNAEPVDGNDELRIICK